MFKLCRYTHRNRDRFKNSIRGDYPQTKASRITEDNYHKSLFWFALNFHAATMGLCNCLSDAQAKDCFSRPSLIISAKSFSSLIMSTFMLIHPYLSVKRFEKNLLRPDELHKARVSEAVWQMLKIECHSRVRLPLEWENAPVPMSRISLGRVL